MLFDSTVRRELSRGFGATLVVILTIVLTMLLIRVIGQAASGAVAPQDVVLLLMFVALGHLPTMLSLSMFVAVVVALGRMYRDHEMVIWSASGIGLVRFVRPVLRTCWPVLLLVALLQLFVWPWGNRHGQDLRDRYERRSDLARVTPGVFQTSADGRRVFFVERESADGVQARNVFILHHGEKVEAVTSARAGRLESVDGVRQLVLERGQRSDVDLQSGERTLWSFGGYRVAAGERASGDAEALPPKAVKTIDLILQPTPRHQGELTWRLGLLLAAANLLLLGIGLSTRNPRRASNWNLLFALMAFIVYYNLVNLTRAWVDGGRMSMGAALVGVHGAALALALALLWWRDRGTTLRLPWAAA